MKLTRIDKIGGIVSGFLGLGIPLGILAVLIRFNLTGLWLAGWELLIAGCMAYVVLLFPKHWYQLIQKFQDKTDKEDI